MTIFRSIVLNENEDIDTTNIGNSWTLCEVFAEDKAIDYNRYAGKDGYVILKAEVEIEDLDIDNTLFAMENRDHEYEVVINNADIVAVIHHTNLESFENVEEIRGNTGNNDFEDYCINYDGDLLIDDFIELVKQF